MQPLERKDVQQLVGDLDDHVIADVIATGADQNDLERAIERIRDASWVDREVDARVLALCEILAPVIARDDEDELYATD
jgi:hypothetical protein